MFQLNNMCHELNGKAGKEIKCYGNGKSKSSLKLDG